MAVTAVQLAAMVQDEQAAEAADFEDQAATAADGGSGAALAVVLAAALAGWVTAFGAVTAAGSGPALAGYLAGVRTRIDKATVGLAGSAAREIEGRLDEAAALGARHAAWFATRAAGHTVTAPAVSAPGDAIAAARDVARTVREQLHLSARLLGRGGVEKGGWQRVLAGIAAARRATTLIRQAASWAVHRSVNAGSRAAIDALGARALWVAEPTACVRCAAYSGRLADRDGHFPGGLSLDPRQRSTTAAAIDGPPIHPNDRCRIVPWRPEWAPRHGSSLPDLLREQALHGAATGHGEPSESRAARRRAARYVSALAGTPASLRHPARAAAAAGQH